MKRLLPYLLGPELYWLMVTLVVDGFAAGNEPPTDSGNRVLEGFTYWLPLIAVPAGFTAFLVPGPSRGWLAAHLFLATAIGLNLSLVIVMGAIDYQDSRNSGLLGVWAIGLAVGILTFAGSALLTWIAARLLARRSLARREVAAAGPRR
jgi:hypothetical protein